MGLMGSLFFGIGKGSGCLFGKHETMRQTLKTKIVNPFLPFTLQHLSCFSRVILTWTLYHPLTLFYTRGLGIVVLHVMVPEPYRFPLCFLK
jgi:hypothetical protein